MSNMNTASTHRDEANTKNELITTFAGSEIVVDQIVGVPNIDLLDWARSGSRKGASKHAKQLAAIDGVSLSEQACELLADHVIDMDKLVAMTRQGFLTRTRAHNLSLDQLVAQIMSICILPVENDRTGHINSSVLRPIEPGTLIVDDETVAVAEGYRVMANYATLRESVKRTVRHTLDLGGSYQESIVAGGVIQPILVRPTVTYLVAENVEFIALEPADGCTRAIAALSVLLDTRNPDAIADFILNAHFQSGIVAPDNTPTDIDITDVDFAEAAPRDISAEVRENLRTIQREKVNAYWAHKGTRTTAGAQAALRMGQALSLPATLTISLIEPPEEPSTFVAAIDTLVRSTHVNNTPWKSAAGANNLARGVLGALWDSEHLDDAERDLLVSTNDDETLKALYALDSAPPTFIEPGLWRAGYLLSMFSRPAVMKATKTAIGKGLNLKRIQLPRYASVIATFIDVPWRESKAKSSAQAHRAWARGGAFTREMFEDGEWHLQDANTIDELLAREGRDTRLTLAALGGTALIADRFLTSDVIAGTSDGGDVNMPYKISMINTLVAMLARDENTDGRLQLAKAAESFQVLGESSSPWRAGERAARQKDLDAIHSDNGRRASDNQPLRPVPNYYETPSVIAGETLNARTLMEIADYDGKETGQKKAAKVAATAKIAAKQPFEIVLEIRNAFLDDVSALPAAIDKLVAAATEHKQPALMPEQFTTLQTTLGQIQGRIYAELQPAPVTAPGFAFEDTDDADLDAEANFNLDDENGDNL